MLIRKMLQNLNTYWASFTRQPGRMVWLWCDYGIQWAVLGVLRQFYTFREGDITSKSGAGEYALKQLPERWHRLIQEALNIRHETPGSLYRFLQFIIRTCNASCG